MAKAKKKLPNCLHVGVGACIVVSVIIFSISFHSGQLSEKNSYDSAASGDEKLNQHVINSQFQRAIERAAHLSMRYRNITGKDSALYPDVLKMMERNKNMTSKMIKEGDPLPEKDLDGADAVQRRNLVIGMAQDTDPKNLVVFCASLREHAEVGQTDIILFVNVPIQSSSIAIANKYRVQLFGFNPSEVDKFPVTIGKYHPSSLRWILIKQFFEDPIHRNKYSRVLLIDVRDSYFQGDPFKIIPRGVDDAFYVFKGVESVTIADCGWNGRWIKDCFGDKILGQVGRQDIICSGVSIGTMGVVYEYVKMMSSILMGSKDSELSSQSKFPTCERNGVDQGVHNVLVHKNLIRNITIQSHRDGNVVNMQGRTAVVDEMLVTSSKGDKYAIVHQYDRYPDIQKALFKKV